MNSRQLLAAGVLSALLLAAPPEMAGGSSATIHVQATVRPYLQFSASQPVTFYQVTAEDLRRGHIDIPGAVTIYYRTNVRDEIQLEIVSDGPERVVFPGSGTTVRIAGSVAGSSPERAFDLRVILPADATEGIYPLLIALAPTVY